MAGQSFPQIDVAAVASGGVAQADRAGVPPPEPLMAPGRSLALNRRSLFRVPVALPVEIAVSPGQTDTVRTTTLDISESGIRTLLPSRLDEDLIVRLALHLSDDEVIVVPAQVRHWVRVTNGYATGLAFAQLSAGDAKLLAQAIARHQRRLRPEVSTSLLVHFTPSSTNRSYPATTIAISPGAVAVHTLDHLELGDRLSLSLRTGHQSFVLGASVVDHQLTEERIRGVLALDVLGRSDESRLRSALDDLQDAG